MKEQDVILSALIAEGRKFWIVLQFSDEAPYTNKDIERIIEYLNLMKTHAVSDLR
jgi:hypothetical protein